MKIRYRLALQFSLIVISIIIIFSLGIYWFAQNRRTNEFNKRLINRAATCANILSNLKNSDSHFLEKINRNTVNFLFNENIKIFSYNENVLLYQYSKDTSSQVVFEYDVIDIKEKGQISYYTDSSNIIGFVYPVDKPRFVIIASAVNERGQYELTSLKQILFFGNLISFVITVLASLFFASEAVKPISGIIRQVNNITASKLHRRVFGGKGTDEIATLSKTFNEMLDRLQEAFEMQRSFVSNVSHELRTPLTSINGQIEIAFLKERTNEDYKRIINSIHLDIINLVTLTNGFLELAEASMDNALPKFQNFRIDELLYKVKEEMLSRNMDYIIEIDYIDVVDDENKFIIKGNVHLIKVLFKNIIDNACKFSNDKRVVIGIKPDETHLSFIFSDKGIGIPGNEMDKILKPFYRAKNTTGTKGYGVGLSIVEKIVLIHNGILHISPNEPAGTKVSVNLPYIT